MQEGSWLCVPLIDAGREATAGEDAAMVVDRDEEEDEEAEEEAHKSDRLIIRNSVRHANCHCHPLEVVRSNTSKKRKKRHGAPNACTSTAGQQGHEANQNMASTIIPGNKCIPNITLIEGPTQPYTATLTN